MGNLGTCTTLCRAFAEIFDGEAGERGKTEIFVLL